MPTNHRNWVIPVDTDSPDAPTAFRALTDSVVSKRWAANGNGGGVGKEIDIAAGGGHTPIFTATPPANTETEGLLLFTVDLDLHTVPVNKAENCNIWVRDTNQNANRAVTTIVNNAGAVTSTHASVSLFWVMPFSPLLGIMVLAQPTGTQVGWQCRGWSWSMAHFV